MDLLPYSKEHGHGPKVKHVEIRAAMEEDENTTVLPYESYPVAGGPLSPSPSPSPAPLSPTFMTMIKRPSPDDIGQFLTIRVTTVPDPMRMFSVYEPGGPGMELSSSFANSSSLKICLVNI